MSTSKKSDKVEQPPNLDEEDDAILNRIWDKIGKEDVSEEEEE